MKLPSIRLALQDARDTFRRFPLILCNAIVGTAASLILVDYEGASQPTVLFNILYATVLGFPLLLSFALHSERKGYTRWEALGVQCVGILLLVGFAFTVPTDLIHAPHAPTVRFFLLAVALIFLVMVVPSAGGGSENGFWQFNRRLFVRVLTTGLYAIVLFSGFALAMAALDNLFNVTVPPRRYGELWVLILGLFCPWFILAGVPGDRTQLESQTDYPKGMKVFALYILSPIVLVYLVILYAYLAKILIAWDWPKGWVSGMILGFASSGICLILMLKPLVEKEGMSWITRAISWFHALLIPLIVMLFLAFWRRISEYGITEWRYLGLAVVVWLTIQVLYYFISKRRSLRFIPLSLCLGVFAVSFGPWGTIAVSESSQIARLERLITGAGILKDGKVTPAHPAVTIDDSKEISSVLSYLHDYHGYDGIQHWFAADLHTDTTVSKVRFITASAVADLMGFTFVQSWEGANAGSVNLQAAGTFSVEGYDRMARLPEYAGATGQLDSLEEGIFFAMKGGLDTLVLTKKSSGEELLKLDLRAHVEAILKSYGTVAGKVPDSIMALHASGKGINVCVCPWLIHVWKNKTTTKINVLQGVLLYSVKKTE